LQWDISCSLVIVRDPNKHCMARGPGAARRAKLGGHNQGCLCCEAPAPTNRSAWLFNPGAGADDDDGT